MTQNIYYDLDGTLSKLNNSYDFAYGYYRYKKLLLRQIIVRLFSFVAKRLIFLPFYKRRKLILTAMFYHIKKKSLEDYYKNSYKDLFDKQLTTLGKKVLKQDNSTNYMLTGCTEIPARSLSTFFGFKKAITTTFTYKKDRITGINIDTFGNHKAKFITREGNNKITYYTDDEKTEQDIKEKVGKFKVVNTV